MNLLLLAALFSMSTNATEANQRLISELNYLWEQAQPLTAKALPPPTLTPSEEQFITDEISSSSAGRLKKELPSSSTLPGKSSFYRKQRRR